MACPITDESQRKFPLKRPEGWVPKMTRYTLRFPSTVNELAITYVGIQQHEVRNAEPSINSGTVQQFKARIEHWIEHDDHKPVIVDRFEVLSGRDIPGTSVWACYWISHDDAKTSIERLNLRYIYHTLSKTAQSNFGLWQETITPDIRRFETNYSGDDYQPGIAGLEGSTQEPHGLTGYWGAARDRIHASAYDSFDGSGNPKSPRFNLKSLGNYITGQNKTTIAHIRSGQYWENCSEEERHAYEEKLEPHLRNGLADIANRPKDLGDFGLRFVRNLPPKDQPQNHIRRETCAAGFSRSLADLESWAKNCPSHHKIYGGALHHVNTFGKEYKMRTWHEVCVLKPSEANWEYINCEPNTGTLAFQESRLEPL